MSVRSSYDQVWVMYAAPLLNYEPQEFGRCIPTRGNPTLTAELAIRRYRLQDSRIYGLALCINQCIRCKNNKNVTPYKTIRLGRVILLLFSYSYGLP